MKVFAIICAAASMLLLAGCWSHPGGIAASTSVIGPHDGYSIIRKDVSGVNYAVTLLTFPIGHPDTEAALKDALKKTEADALINVTVDNAYACFIFFTLEYTIVHGDAVKIEKGDKHENKQRGNAL